MEDEEDSGMQTPGDAASAPAPKAAYSYIYPIGYSNSSECGYCRLGPSAKRYNYYASTTSLAPSLYQKLVDRCWRRSGTLLYRPNQKHSCCPHYTLRLDSTEFKPTKDQRQAVNRFNRYVLGEEYARQAARLYPQSREEARKRETNFDLLTRIHEAESHNVRIPPEAAHEFTVTLEPDAFTEEKYSVYENYQRVVHHEDASKISHKGFKRFLCDSPLRRETYTDPDGRRRQLGSFHQCYRLDGRLVAIGVLDLLPDAVSSVYFLYDECMHPHNPGKLGAMREIALAIEHGYRWWYSGYYIHSCPKMQYKIDYSPQYVLDPEALQWDLLDKETLKILDRKPYVSLANERKRLVSSENGSNVYESDQGNDEDRADPSLVVDSFLFTRGMPGVPSLEQMRQVNMDNMAFKTDHFDDIFRVSDLVVWATDDIGHYGVLKARVAELVAAAGPDLMDEICLDFRRS